MEIVIPNLDDDEDDYSLPPFARPAFGSGSNHTTPEAEPFNHRSPAIHEYPSRLATPARPILPKGSASYQVGPSYGGGSSGGLTGSIGGNAHEILAERPKFTKFSNGSSSSLITPGTSISSASGLQAHRKGSFASLKNAFKSGSGSGSGPTAPPPLPTLNTRHLDKPGYPALKNPFSFDPGGPSSPTSSYFNLNKSTNNNNSQASFSHSQWSRKQSVATNHSSQRSYGGRSVGSQGSSTFDHPTPSLPPVPSRGAPSRLGRFGSDAESVFSRKQGSLGEEALEAAIGRTPADEALRIIFGQFRDGANEKVARILARPLNVHPSLGAYLDAGVDKAFDEIVTSVAQCGKRQPRRIVDLLNAWCRAHCEGIAANEVRAHLKASLGLQIRVEDAATILGGRKASAARYILNRAILELLRSTSREALGEELGMTMESTTFNTYRSERFEEHMQFPHRKEVSTLQVELLGQLSSIRFLTVSDRFTRELGKYTSLPTREAEARVEHLLKGMRHLKIRVYPEDELEMSAEFLQALAAFFSTSHGNNLKTAYAETLVNLLHPVVETATAEVNHPMWSKAVAVILHRALAMLSKPRYWQVAFPLVIVALGVSPREVFMQHWQMCIDAIQAKMRDRALRPIAVGSFIRLLWIYLNRGTESSTSMRKRLDPLLRLFLSQSDSLDALAAILHYVMTRHLDYGEELVGEHLNASSSSRGGDSALGHLTQNERATAMIRASLYTLTALESDQSVNWPKHADFSRFDFDFAKTADALSADLIDKGDIGSFLKRIGPGLLTLFQSCDRALTPLLLSNDNVTIVAHASSATDSADGVTQKHGDVYVAYPARHQATFNLFSSLCSALPRCLPLATDFVPLTPPLCRATFSADPKLCVVAGEALLRIAEDPSACQAVVDTYQQFIFETRHVFRDTLVGTRLLDSQFERVITLWADLLALLVSQSRTAQAQEDNGAARSIPLAQIERYEASALFLLCSTNVVLRKQASRILVAARDMEGSTRRPSAAFRYSRLSPDMSAITRVLQLYDGTLDEAAVTSLRQLPWLTSHERGRLDIHIVDNSKLVQRIAESDHQKDSALWLAILPVFIGRIQTMLPGTAAQFRQLVAQTVIRFQGYIALIASASSARDTPGTRSTTAPKRPTSDITILAEYWRAYCAVLCVTQPNESPNSGVQAIKSTKDAIIMTPDTIGTPALFHYLTSHLAWEDPRFKDAAVYALGSIGQSQLRPLSEILLGVVRRLADTRAANGNGSVRDRQTLQGSTWTALSHVFRLVSPLILDSRSNTYLANLSSMIGFVKASHTLLSDRAVKEDYDLQSLRRSFCIVVENLTTALGKLDSSERFLGDDFRGAIFKLCYEWCHVGRRPDVVKARESQTLQAAADAYRGDRDRAGYLDDLQVKTKLLSVAAADAMAGLCQGKLISANEATPAQQASEHIVEPLSVLRWIRGMFASSHTSHRETARKALFALVKYNWSSGRLLDEVLHQSFGEGEQFALESSFFGIVANVLTDNLVRLPIEQIACLALTKLGHSNVDVRQRAFQLSVSLVENQSDKLELAILLPAIGSASPNVYQHAQQQVATRLASLYPDTAFSFLDECTSRLSQLEAPRRQAALNMLPPWLEVIELVPDEQLDQAYRAMSNILYLVGRFSADHLEVIEAICQAFAGSAVSHNVTAFVKFLFQQCGKRKSPEIVQHAQRVMACLAQSPAATVLFDEICNFVEPAAMAALPDEEMPANPMTSLANLDSLMSASTGKSQTFSTGQLALLFAGELLPHRMTDSETVKRLPTLLHVALIHSDHTSLHIREPCQAVLFQILRAWISDTSNAQTGNASAAWAMAETKLSTLLQSRHIAFWKSDDGGVSELAFTAPPKMTALVMKILGIILPLQQDVRQQWGELALSWATSCPIRHLACRSFQLFRILSPRVNPRMMSDTLARLSSTIASETVEIQSFNQEIIRTFASVVHNLSTMELASFPQIFWCAVACLSTPYENEYAEVLELFTNILDKTNLSDPAVVSHLTAFRPTDWVGPFPYLQPLVLVGLKSSKTVMLSFDLIRRLASSPNDDMIDAPNDRLIHGFIAALPWMLHSTDTGEPNDDLAAMATDLASIADCQGNAGFSRLLTSFARVRFRAKDDFIRQASSLIRDYMATHALGIITLLLGFTLNDQDWMREKSLQVLKIILAFPDARAPLAAHGEELLLPILRLIPTKHSAQALDVLDLPFTASMTPHDNNNTSHAGEIFGPFSESGWSIPNAEEVSLLTRENLTAVFNTCAVETRAASAHFSVVQFADIKQFAPNPTFDSPPPLPEDGGIMMMDHENASMGDLVGALHSLNQFFDDGLDGAGSPTKRSMQDHTRMPSETISEKRVRAIMARGKTPSISSPIYETSQGIIPPRTRQAAHTRSETLTSEASSTDFDLGENATQRVGAGYRNPYSQSQSQSQSNPILGSSVSILSSSSIGISGPSNGTGRGEYDSSTITRNRALAPAQPGQQGQGHRAQLSMSSFSGVSDVEDESQFALDERGDDFGSSRSLVSDKEETVRFR